MELGHWPLGHDFLSEQLQVNHLSTILPREQVDDGLSALGAACGADVNKLYFGDNLDILREYIRDRSIDLIYLDPPFNSVKAGAIIPH